MVLHTIIRKTYGWNKKEDWITGTQIAQMTGLCRQRVYEALKALQAKRVIMRDGRLVGIQKDYTFWQDVTEKRYNGKVTQKRTPVTKKRVKKTRKTVTTKDKRNYTKDRDKPRQSHPAIQVYAELTGKKPRDGTLQYDRIKNTVGTATKDLKQWREVIEAWLLSDYKPTNLRGMLEWFKHGIPMGKTAQEAKAAQADEQEAKEKMKRDLEIWQQRQQAEAT